MVNFTEDDLQISSRGREKKFKLLFKYVDQNLFLTDKSDVLVPVNYGLSTKHNILKEFPSDSGVKVAGVYSEEVERAAIWKKLSTLTVPPCGNTWIIT